MGEKVQILLATYNGERFVAQQIDSLLQQSYEDIEILCRDDGSIDETISILQRYQSTYPDKVKVILDGEPTGSPTGNFMRLLGAADAPYVMFCDQDDYWFPEKVEETIALMRYTEASQEDAPPVLVFSDYITTDADLKPIQENKKNSQIYKAHTDLRHLLVQNYVTGCTAMLNRELYSNIISDSPAILMHDGWAALCAAASGKLIYLNKPLMFYRQHGGNCVGTVNIKSPKYILSKIRNSETKNSMHLYKKQAEALLEEYELIDRRSRKIIEQFIDLFHYRKLKRCEKLIKGKYFKSTWTRILGQLWYV